MAEERIVIQEGEKNRVINVKVGAAGPAAPVPPPKTAEPPASAPVGGYLLLGAAAVGASAFGVLAALGQKDLDEMKDPGGCAPRCDESRVTAARTKIVAANVSLGVGLVAAGLGTYFLLKPRHGGTGFQLGVRPVAGGAATDLAYRF